MKSGARAALTPESCALATRRGGAAELLSRQWMILRRGRPANAPPWKGVLGLLAPRQTGAQAHPGLASTVGQKACAGGAASWPAQTGAGSVRLDRTTAQDVAGRLARPYLQQPASGRRSVSRRRQCPSVPTSAEPAGAPGRTRRCHNNPPIRSAPTDTGTTSDTNSSFVRRAIQFPTQALFTSRAKHIKSF